MPSDDNCHTLAPHAMSPLMRPSRLVLTSCALLTKQYNCSIKCYISSGSCRPDIAFRHKHDLCRNVTFFVQFDTLLGAE